MPYDLTKNRVNLAGKKIRDLPALQRGLAAGKTARTKEYDIVAAAIELVTVARLRDDNVLPDPTEDPKPWTARMQTAWRELESLVDDPDIREHYASGDSKQA